MLQFFIFVKNILTVFPVHLIFHPLSRVLLFFGHLNYLTAWIYANKKECLYAPKLTVFRKNNARLDLYEFVAQQYQLESEPIHYLEFGVASGSSLQWWLAKNQNPDSLFWGFDTFEGLPEQWGAFFKKGDMNYGTPKILDQRVTLIKGLFQESFPPFLQEHHAILKKPKRKIIHLDADLYSSTLFVLSQSYSILHKGDILLFDEFCVPLHEFKAYKEFTESFYVQLKPLGYVNNFVQVAFIVQ